MGKSLAVPQKVRHRIARWPSNSTPRYVPRKLKAGLRYLYSSVQHYWQQLKRWKQPNCASADEQVNETWSIHMMEYSVPFSRSVVSNSLRPHEPQHTRPPCPSPTPGVHSDSCLLSWWCHPVISPSVIPFSFCPQSLPASESFPMSQLFTWGGHSIEVSSLASVLPVTTRTGLL